jgi:uncharacterized Zn finger protein
MPNVPLQCVVCGTSDIIATRDGAVWLVSCESCGTSALIEFDPPDAPGLAGRIEILIDRHRHPVPVSASATTARIRPVLD